MKKPVKKKKKRSNRKKVQGQSQPNVQTAEEQDSKKEEKGSPIKIVQPLVKKEPEKKRDEKKDPLRYIKIATQFLKESKIELKKVKWPTKKELLASTAMVLFLVLIISLFLGIIDFGLMRMIAGLVG